MREFVLLCGKYVTCAQGVQYYSLLPWCIERLFCANSLKLCSLGVYVVL